jgi:hypothetical protein
MVSFFLCDFQFWNKEQIVYQSATEAMACLLFYIRRSLFYRMQYKDNPSNWHNIGHDCFPKKKKKKENGCIRNRHNIMIFLKYTISWCQVDKLRSK